MKDPGRFLGDKRGSSSMVVRLVLAVAIAAAVLVTLLQILHADGDAIKNATGAIDLGMRNGAGENMKYLTD